MRFALALVLLAGCNQVFGFDDGDLRVVDAATVDAPIDAMIDAAPPDAGPDAFSGVCDPVAQIGCGGGEKCTWILIDVGVGQIGCVPDGNVAIGGSCTHGPNGLATGYDNCAAGSYCAGELNGDAGHCHVICDRDPDSCGAEQRCGAYSGLFNGTGETGLCDFTCDPVTQTRDFDGAAACGSTTPADPDFGCYKYDEQPGICTNVAAGGGTQTQDETAYNWPTGVFLNGCAPGYAPLARASSDVAGPVICMAYCRPQETSTASTAGFGGVPGSGFTCANRGASGKECHFIWYLWDMPTAADNGVGFCWTPGNYTGDFDNDPGTPDTAHPTCTSLPNTDTDSDGLAQNYQYGCAPYVE